MKRTRISLPGGVTLTVLPSDRFKTECISLNFLFPLRRETVTAVSLLRGLLLRGCEGYPSFESVSSRLDELYGAEVTVETRALGNVLALAVTADYLAGRYSADGTDIVGGVLDLLRRILFSPVKIADPATLESEKKHLADEIAAEINDKGVYARRRLLETMFEGESAGINVLGYREDLDAITPEGEEAFYRSLLASAPVEMFVVGDLTKETARGYAEVLFSDAVRSPVPLALTPPAPKKAPPRPRILLEEEDVRQARLVIGYRAPAALSPDKPYSDFLLACEILGVSSSSKLFMHVREELNLCYSCGSEYRGALAAMFVYAGIDAANLKKTLDAVRREVAAVAAGEITDEELLVAKKSLRTSILAGLDSPRSMILHTLFRSVAGFTDDQEALVARILAATKEDAAAAMRGASPDTVYFLSDNKKLAEEAMA